VLRTGAAPTTLYGLTCRSCRGQRTGHKHIRVPQELGRPGLSPGVFFFPVAGTGSPTPGPRLRVLDRRERNDRRSAWYRQAKETKRGERDTGSRTSS